MGRPDKIALNIGDFPSSYSLAVTFPIMIYNEKKKKKMLYFQQFVILFSILGNVYGNRVLVAGSINHSCIEYKIFSQIFNYKSVNDVSFFDFISIFRICMKFKMFTNLNCKCDFPNLLHEQHLFKEYIRHQQPFTLQGM